MRKILLLALALFAWSVVTNAQEKEERYIEVTDSSEIEVVPDEIHFFFRDLQTISHKIISLYVIN